VYSALWPRAYRVDSNSPSDPFLKWHRKAHASSMPTACFLPVY
jgi:hypothetical protein